MDIRECAWCGKAIYGDNYYVGTGGYCHRDCQIPDGSDCLTTMGGTGGTDGCREVASLPEAFLSSDGQLLKQELARLKELNRGMVELIKRIELDVDDLIVGEVNMIAWSKRSLEISQVLNKAKAEEGEGE